MAFNGTYRTKRVKVTKYADGVPASGYPKYYYIVGGGTTFTYNGGPVSEDDLITMEQGEIGITPSYLDMLEDFKAYVEALETGLDLTVYSTNTPYGTDARLCKIGYDPYYRTYSTGLNDSGQLGIGSNDNASQLSSIGLSNVLTLDAGNNHAAYITSDLKLYLWGDNSSYQLGDGTTTDQNSPQPITGDFVKVSCGHGFTAAIDSDGFLWTWGLGSSGQLGNGATTDETTPYKVGTDTWIDVSCGRNHLLAINSDGELWACGNNDNGQLGDGTITQRTSLVQIGSKQWLSVSAGKDFSAAIGVNGRLYTWGLNDAGQLGSGSLSTRTYPTIRMADAVFTKVSCGNQHTAAIDNNNVLYTTGLNTSGQLGIGSFSVKTSFTLSDTGVVDVSCGYNHTLSVKNSGLYPGVQRIYGCGSNDLGQLGVTSTLITASFVEMDVEEDYSYPGMIVSAGTSFSLYARMIGTSDIYAGDFNDDFNEDYLT